MVNGACSALTYSTSDASGSLVPVLAHSSRCGRAPALARTPYDLRHAAVSTWLNGGVPPTTVAEWAGHSVEVLLRIYAKCLDGGDALVRRRVQAALGYADEVTGSSPITPT
jgi:integrase